MSRRKQSKPRALKRPDEEDEVSAAMETTDDLAMSGSVTSDTEEAEPPAAEAQATPDNGQEMEEATVSRDVAMATGEEEEAEEEYRCETCNTLFHSLMQFMDHRNYDCVADGENWKMGEGSSTSCPSSPYSTETHSPLVGLDPPYSPGTAATPLDQLPHSLGVDENNPYPCQFCKMAFPKLGYLKKHEQIHSDQLPYKCKFCMRLFKHKRSRDRHVKLHTGDRKYKCQHCDSAFSRSDHLKIHLKTHDASKSFMSDDIAMALDDHHDEPLSPRPQPEVKPLTTKSRGEKRPHVDSGHDKCPVCGAKFVNMEDLYEHMKLIHHAVLATPPFMDPETSSSKSAKEPRLKGEKISCPYCSRKGFASMGMLNVHIRTMHTGIADHLFSCQVCQVGFSSSTKLADHMKSDHGALLSQSDQLEIKFPCDYCPVEFTNAETLKHHKENVHKLSESAPKLVEVVYCSQCTAGFPHIYALAEHMHNSHGYSGRGQSQTSPVSINGSISPSTTPDKHGLHVISPDGLSVQPFKDKKASPAIRTGLSNTHGVDSFNCDHCNATFPDLKSYQVHIKNHVEPNIGKYPCTECQAEFTSEEQLENHVFMHFLVLTTEYGCTSCLKLFSKPDELQKHLMDIHAHHLYRCSLCKEIFDSKVNIQVHFAIKHSNECKLYKCTTCGSVFRSEMEWQLHVKVQHLGISKPYRCFFCRESFGSESDLQSHMASHKKQYTCPLCDEAFLVEYLLDKHMQTKHSQPEGAKVKVEKENESSDFHGYAPPAPPKTPTLSKSSAPKLSVSPPMMKHPSPVHSRPSSSPSLKKEDLIYKCGICDVKFSDEGTLQKHRMHDHSISPEMNLMMQKSQAIAQAAQESAANTKLVQTPGADKFSQLCVYCNQTFKTKSELEKHMKTHVTPSNQKCNICDEIFPSASILAEHKLTHCKVVKGNVCVVCKVAMKSEEQFYSHSQQHGFQGTSMQCVVCRQTLASMLELQMHGRHHFQNATTFFTCCVCLKSFDSKENLISKLNTSGRSYYVCKPCYHGEQQSEFPCSTCGAKFESQVQLESHMLQHRKTFQCIKCQQSFATEYEIQLHVASHVMAEGNIHQCYMCNCNFDSPAKLQCHLIEHTYEEGEMTCYVCNISFSDASGIQVHVLEHGVGARRYTCTQCPQSFFFSGEYQNHLLSHSQGSVQPQSQVSPSDYQCPDCPKVLSSLAALISHRKTHDKPEAGHLRCSMCDETYTSMTELQQHFFMAHSPSDKDKPRRKDLTASLSSHMDTNSSSKTSLSSVTVNKPYECPVCHKRFTRKENRKAHMKLHSAGLSQTCPVCKKVFTKRSLLSEHMRIHFSQGGMHTCNACGESFHQSRHLRRHQLMVHNQVPDYTCQLCSEAFPQAKDLRNHLQQTHNFNEDHLDSLSIGSNDSSHKDDLSEAGDDGEYHGNGSYLTNGHDNGTHNGESSKVDKRDDGPPDYTKMEPGPPALSATPEQVTVN